MIVRSESGERLLEGVAFEPEQANREEVARIAAIKKANADKRFASLIETSILDRSSP